MDRKRIPKIFRFVFFSMHVNDSLKYGLCKKKKNTHNRNYAWENGNGSGNFVSGHSLNVGGEGECSNIEPPMEFIIYGQQCLFIPTNTCVADDTYQECTGNVCSNNGETCIDSDHNSCTFNLFECIRPGNKITHMNVFKNQSFLTKSLDRLSQFRLGKENTRFRINTHTKFVYFCFLSLTFPIPYNFCFCLFWEFFFCIHHKTLSKCAFILKVEWMHHMQSYRQLLFHSCLGRTFCLHLFI